ncbi:cyclic-di-AMP receptor [Alkalicoccus urumqiensis]|uniref:Transcriptional regulator n=1 Tax=Alkalicoccus urumqiensis TaxID=1548213 RepID=A0A2P6MGT0_ALKUR|nr:cyclic-di-AMP receptor [Alkalicoccus urumqiensis]PRO65495.1 transcriptional regulator [Alkalicoccus urumqiensis]
MKLMVCIVQPPYRDAVEDGLNEAGYRMTELSSSGSFFRKGSTTFLIGIEEADAPDVFKKLQTICLEMEDEKGKPKDLPHRYISFLLPAENAAPLLASQRVSD